MTHHIRLRLSLPALLTAVIGCWYTLYLIYGDSLPGLGVINAFGHHWAMLAIACSVWAALRRGWVAAGTALLLAICILLPIYWPLPASGTSAQKMRVVTASLRTRNIYMNEAARSLADLNPDILILQEVRDPDTFLQTFLTGRPNWHVARRKDLLIIARWPTVPVSSEFDGLRARIEAPGNAISLWNVHAPKDYRNVINNRRYFLTLVEEIGSGGLGIAAGDFNATPWNEGYGSVASVMVDGYRRTRWMPGFTFPGPARRGGRLGPLFAIDHIFASSKLRPLDSFVAPASRGADHLPVIVDYALPRR